MRSKAEFWFGLGTSVFLCLSAQAQLRFEPLVFEANQPKLSVLGGTTSNVVIETSINLTNWSFLYSGTPTNGRVDFLPSARSDKAFYRAYTTRITPVSGLEMAQNLAGAISAASTEDARSNAVMNLMRELKIGVYTSSLAALAKGVERSASDFYLYDFEVGLLAKDMALGNSWTVGDIAPLINTLDLRSGGGSFTDEEIFSVLKNAAASAVQSSDDRTSMTMLVVREIGLRRQPSYDLAGNLVTDDVSFDALQKFLIMADILLPSIASMEPPSVPVSHAKAQDRLEVSNSIHVARSGCAEIGEAALGNWSAGATLIALLGLGGSALQAAAVGIDSLHGMVLALGVSMRRLEDDHSTHYSYIHCDQQVDSGKPLVFRVRIRMEFDLPENLVNCGWIAGVKWPRKGPIEGVRVLWKVGALDRHGSLPCTTLCSSLTDANGIAVITFTPKTIQLNRFSGPEHIQRSTLVAIGQVQAAHNNALGALSNLILPQTAFMPWQIQYHDPGQWSGTLHVELKGTSSTTFWKMAGYTEGTADATLSEQFTQSGAADVLEECDAITFICPSAGIYTYTNTLNLSTPKVRGACSEQTWFTLGGGFKQAGAGEGDVTMKIKWDPANPSQSVDIGLFQMDGTETGSAKIRVSNPCPDDPDEQMDFPPTTEASANHCDDCNFLEDAVTQISDPLIIQGSITRSFSPGRQYGLPVESGMGAFTDPTYDLSITWNFIKQ